MYLPDSPVWLIDDSSTQPPNFVGELEQLSVLQVVTKKNVMISIIRCSLGPSS